MKKVFLILVIFQCIGCAELQQVVNQLPQGGVLSNEQIANGLTEALNQGIQKQVSKLTLEDGYYKNELVKILLPTELQKIDKTLRDIGLGNLADQGLKAINRAAEDAVGEATPIFIAAVKNISFTDAKTILTGADDAATTYLTTSTETELYNKFNPVIKNSFTKVGADKIWEDLITRYNNIPFTKDVNPDLTDYVTNEALKGVYTMIAVEEKEIRTKVSSRTSAILKQVFALQD
ncbi:DUF4197 domain-containing protein [Cellulophaga sp. F20128]|uniref:DUF4197 domain-containing protein n=1 Tax=Cellulophaga sp. F20128 TaxID=2926413 RepID=UPI001FF11745|nr:DUF4197 domain-containing protein [Cellulophaga sp. F20128]MCK0158524.1 DUF4197 domain-containing protein [Cellulophaga sp. F20128]